MQRRRNVGKVQALPREVVFGIFIKLFDSIMRSLHTRQTKWLGLFLEQGTELNIPARKVYKQAVSCVCFHFLTVVIWH